LYTVGGFNRKLQSIPIYSLFRTFQVIYLYKNEQKVLLKQITIILFPHKPFQIAHLKNKNIGILITDHNVQETLAITERSYLMFEGGILKAGVPEELAMDEMVRKVYLGQNFELHKKKLDF